jgi:hypothetical protein
MNRFKVWIRTAGSDCKVRVDGIQNCDWLRRRLREKGFESTAPETVAGSPHVVFHAECPPQVSTAQLQKTIESMHDVELMLDPA